MNKRNENGELLLRYLRNEASEEEMVEVLDWLDADEMNRKMLNEMDLASNFATLTDEPTVVSTHKTIPLWRKVARWSVAAAVIAGAFVGGHFSSIYRDDAISAKNMMAVNVPNGQRVSITLSDGTSVWLNSGSTIEYPTVFGTKQRRVKISGEAMFDVARNDDKPFIVETFASEIKVLGTKFDVVANEHTNTFITTLLRGKVQVIDTKTDQSVILRPNEMVNLDASGALIVSHSIDPVSMQWIDGIVSMKGMTFEKLITKFEQIYDVRIVIERESIPDIRFESGKLRISDGIDHAFAVLQHFADFTYIKDESSNIIKIK